MKVELTLVAFLAASLGMYAQVSEGPLSPATASNISLTGSSASWSNTGNVFASDDSYATSSLSSNGDFTDYIQITNFGFGLPTNAIILGIEVEIERFGSNVKDNQISIVKGGTIGATDRSVNPSWSNSDNDSYTTYGSDTDLWGETWVASDINATNFGIAISASKQGGGGSSDPHIDHVRITVHYEVALPVGFLRFESRQMQMTVKLDWSTAWEQDNSHFEVQRSVNGQDFEPIGYVGGANDSAETLYYEFTDTEPHMGRNFYRLKQQDFTGTFDFSEITSIYFKSVSQPFKVYPTVVDDVFVLETAHENLGRITMHVFNLRGDQIYSVKPSKLRTEIRRDFFPSSGIYIYRITSFKGLVSSGKFIVN